MFDRIADQIDVGQGGHEEDKAEWAWSNDARLHGSRKGGFDHRQPQRHGWGKGVHWDEREELMALIAELSRPENYGCVLIVEDIDRLLRDEMILYRMGPIFITNGIRIYDSDGYVDGEKLLDGAAKAVAAYKLLCKRSLQNRRIGMREGRIHGGIPWGYEYSGRARMRADENRHHVYTIFHMFVGGENPATIARFMERQGVRGPGNGEWKPYKVWTILRRETYTGWLVYSIKNEPEPIRVHKPELEVVPRELFERARVIELLTSAGIKPRTVPVSQAGKLPLLLSGSCREATTGAKVLVKSHDTQGRRRLVAPGIDYAFDGDRTEAISLGFLREVLHDDEFQKRFRLETVASIRAEALRIDAERLDLGKELVRERQLYDKNRQLAYEGDRHSYEDLLNKSWSRIETLEAEISGLKSAGFAKFAEEDIPLLTSEIDDIIAGGTFECVTTADEQLRRIVQTIVCDVTLEATSRTGRKQVTVLDFGKGIGLDDPDLRFEQSREYEETPQMLNQEKRTRIQKMLDAEDWRLGDEEAERLLAQPVVDQYFGALPAGRLRQFLGIVHMVAQRRLPLELTLDLGGFEKSEYRRAFGQIRKSEVALGMLVDALAEVRGAAIPAFFGRVRSKKSPLERMVAVAHPLLQHPICQPGGKAMTDEQWTVVRQSLLSTFTSPRAAERFVTARIDLDNLFRAVREELTMVQACSKNAASNTNRRITEAQACGDFERLTRALLEHAGLPPAAGAVPFF